jgi:hypothetical protein
VVYPPPPPPPPPSPTYTRTHLGALSACTLSSTNHHCRCRYQDGGHWATPLDKILPFVARYNTSWACNLLSDVVESFRSKGVWEWTGPIYNNHVVQFTNSSHTLESVGVAKAAAHGVRSERDVKFGQGAQGYIASITNVLGGAEAIEHNCV